MDFKKELTIGELVEFLEAIGCKPVVETHNDYQFVSARLHQHEGKGWNVRTSDKPTLVDVVRVYGESQYILGNNSQHHKGKPWSESRVFDFWFDYVKDDLLRHVELCHLYHSKETQETILKWFLGVNDSALLSMIVNAGDDIDALIAEIEDRLACEKGCNKDDK